MKYPLLIICFLFSACTLRPFFAPPLPKEVPDSLVQPPIVDPIDLIIDGSGAKELLKQSHIKPFMVISLLAILVCLIPFLAARYSSQAAQLKDWVKRKVKELRDKKKKDV